MNSNLNLLTKVFQEPQEVRENIISSHISYRDDIPSVGSSFFIHLSELCPVACEHCMYSSDLNKKSLKDSLDKDDLAEAINLINDSRSKKLNITGGGEPFLKFSHILRLIEMVQTPIIEIVTAGYWAKTKSRCAKILNKLEKAHARNPYSPELRLRLSLDRYHVNAPRPVLIEYYANVAQAWSEGRSTLSLGYRSIQPDRGSIDRHLAETLSGKIERVNDWNHKVVLPNGEGIPITFNVMRFSGKASEIDDDDILDNTQDIKEYYEPFETSPGRLSLATATNDAIRGVYRPDQGVALTLNSDGTLWIFCGTSPERKLSLGKKTFLEAVRHFYRDPITRFLATEGIWSLAEIARGINEEAYDRAIIKNDVANIVEDLLDDEGVRLGVTLLVLQKLKLDGAAIVESSDIDSLINMPTSDLTSHIRSEISGEKALCSQSK